MAKAKSFTLCYGDSGTGKTSLIESLATWLWRKEKKRTRVITADGGGWDPIEHLVQMKIVEPWQVDTHEHPFETLNLAAEGYWPEDPTNPHSKLIAPFISTCEAFCGKCKKVVWSKETRPGPKFICPTANCKARIGSGTEEVQIKQVRKVNPAAKLNEVGGYAFEGLTAFGSKLMNSLIARGAKGEKIGQDPVAKFTDGETHFASSNMQYYGIVQNRLQDPVERSKFLGGMHVYWTALEIRATDNKDTRLPVFGPELAGKAKTSVAPSWFGNTLSIVKWPMPSNKTERRLYLETYFDADNPSVPHICKNRIPAVVGKDVPEYLVIDDPKADETWGLGKFLELVEAKREEAAKLYGPGFVGGK